EIKRRSNTVILKARAAAHRDSITDIVTRQLIPSSADDKQKEVLRQFQLYIYCLKARPMVVVKYQRQAFEGHSGSRVRINFDRDLSFMQAKDLNFKVNGNGYQRLVTNFVILEIKFTDRYPAWLGNVIRCFNLPLMAMSKYVESLTQASMLGFCAPEISTYG
ncbi:MAG: VTC domain-containing protein, partial [Planctomycetes bacterium]|nr:VTC domain-containing protein [Planctomycetota bacterium]